MAQTYKMMLGTSGKQWEQLTVKDDGTMTMTFHGTNREISHDVTENADGWLCYPGGMFPGLASGRWQLTADVAETTNFTNYTNNHAEQAVVTETTNYTNSHAELEVIETTTDCTDLTDVEPVVVETNTNGTNNKPRPRRQRKPRNPRVERQTSSISHQTSSISHHTSSIDHQPSAISHQTSSTLKAVGMVAAATVALFVIYETGLLIPLGLIGLATGGILK